MMEAEEDAASAAFRNVLILERVMELSDFEKLKELRLVNKHWNETARVILRKRCTLIVLYGDLKQFDSEFDSLLPNRDIIAKLPMRLNLGFKDVFGEDYPDQVKCIEFLEKRFAKARWLDQVVHVILRINLSVADTDLVTSFLLHHLPGLKELKLDLNFWGGEQCYHLGNGFTVPSTTDDARFKLEKLEYGWYNLINLCDRCDKDGQGIDPTFLRHCQNLKMIHFEVHSAKMIGGFLGFYLNWKKMVEENPHFHRIPQLKFYLEDTPRRNIKVLEALIDFIMTNEMTWLEIEGDFACYNSIFYPKIGLWKASIQFLKMLVPTEVNVPHADSALRMLKKCPSFAHLSEIYLDLDRIRGTRTGRPLELDHSQFRKLSIRGIDKFRNVVNLTVDYGTMTASNVTVLLQVAPHLPNVTRCKLVSYSLTSYDGFPEKVSANNIFDGILTECREFPRLGHLCIEVVCYDFDAIDRHTISNTVDAIKTKQVHGGIFKNLSVIEGLKTLEIKMSEFCVPEKVEEILVALFYGYEPKVGLQMELFKFLPDGSKGPDYRCKFTVEEFKQKQKEAEEEMLK